MTTAMTVTAEATTQLRDLLSKEDPGTGLRVFVSPGGCSGLSYGMTFETEPADDDFVIENDGLKIYVDMFSSSYLEGSEIDYVDSLMGGGFTINNPNAVRTCACGHSFDTGVNTGTAAVLDFRETAPAAATPDMYPRDADGEPIDRLNDLGYLAVGVPGQVAGMAEALGRWGTIGLERALAPAIERAEGGVAVTEFMAAVMRREIDRLRYSRDGRRVFLDAAGEP